MSAPGARTSRGVLLVVLAATAAVYARAVACPFVNWDDPYHVTANPLITRIDLPALLRVPENQIFHPVAMLTWALEYHFVGLTPWLYHLDNLLLHLANVALLAALLGKLLSERRALAAIAVGVFALHPLQVETVAWVTARKDLLCTALTLAAWLAWLRFRAASGARALASYALALALFPLALGAKPMAMTLPALLWLGDRWQARVAWWRSAAELLPFGAVALAYASEFPLTMPPPGDLTGLPIYTLGLGDRIGIAAEGVVFYLSRFLWPARLAIFYDIAALRVGALDYALAAAFAVGLGIWCARRPGDRRAAIAALAFFAVCYAPVSKLVPFSGNSLYNDRYLYLPSVGLALAAALPLAALFEREAKRRAGAAICALLAAALALRSADQVGIWRSSRALWEQVLAHYPGTAIAQHQLGVAALEEERDPERSLSAFEAAVRIDPNFTQSWVRQGLVNAELGRPERAAAAFERALAVAPKDAHTRGIAANFYIETQQYERAIQVLEEALAIVPGYPKFESNVGIAELRLGNLAAARAAFLRALAGARPDEVERIRANLARVAELEASR
jgi:tetratricopeptide (TPR) repeat protein